MSTSVSGALAKFRREQVDIDQRATGTARNSRGYLVEQLTALSQRVDGFPRLLGDYLSYGSFARSTKIRPLNDIDLMVFLASDRTQRTIWRRQNIVQVFAGKASPLHHFTNSGGTVNSTRVLNSIRDSLSSIANYRSAELHRRQQAVTLNLASYPWVFDIVPAIVVTDRRGEKVSYFLIPNGAGNWMPTDPRRDRKYVTDLNTRHNGLLLPAVRLLKYWARRLGRPDITSYYFEMLCCRVFSTLIRPLASLQAAAQVFFSKAAWYAFWSLPDPKRLGPALDGRQGFATKIRLMQAIGQAERQVNRAVLYEKRGQHDQAIESWCRVFGTNFPAYE